MKLPAEIENKILSELGLTDIEQNLKNYSKDIIRLRNQMTQLSYDFFHNQATESKFPDAYFAYNYPQNFMKTRIVVRRLYNLYKIPLTQPKITILDLGCGEGAGSFGLYYFLNQIRADIQYTIYAVEIAESSLNRCVKLGAWFNVINHNIAIRPIKKSVKQFIAENRDRYDFVIIANLLGELFKQDKIPYAFFSRLSNLVKNDGFIFIIEPALKKLAQRLMKLRNEIIANQAGNVLLPCLHNNLCPVLFTKEEWCHHSIKWTPPEYIKILNQTLYRKIEYIKFSYLVFSQKKLTCSYENLYPVISRPFREKGRKRCFLCDKNGIVELVRLNRDADTKNIAFDSINMNDLIQLKNAIIAKQSFWKIYRETEIKILDF